MSDRLILALILAALWGVFWAACLQWTVWGRWMALKRTWLTVVIGVGTDLLIALLVTPLDVWAKVAGIVAVSSIGIIARSLYLELRDDAQ